MFLLMIGGLLAGQEPLPLTGAPPAAAAPVAGGDAGFLMICTALVLMMSIPGLALLYGGLVRTKNALSLLIQCFAIVCLISLLWVAYGYSLCFDQGGMVAGEFTLRSLIGGFGLAGLSGMTPGSVHPLATTIPESVFCAFQLTFAVITPALVVGAFAERVKFSAALWFAGLWFTFVYCPICHMMWGGKGSLFDLFGTLDFAGGTVVEINSGVAGLVAALIVGKRIGYPQEAMKPHSLAMVMIGASLLWVGWFGFN
ncbi:MAG: ammonium transporter, partial [Planctomycetes bacterium]|nr:ammonium transporter [Planctomycetota bacterium]